MTDIYLSQDQHGFNASTFLKAVVTPRPIAFITSLSPAGIVNAAPFSYFNIISTNPCLIGVSIGRQNGKRKDTSQNISLNQEFVVNICPTHFANILDLTSKSYPPEISEIDIAQLELLPSSKIAPPRVAKTLAQLECVLEKVVEVGEDPVDFVIGQVVNIHVVKEMIDVEGRVDRSLFHPIARSIGNKYHHQ